MSFAGVAAVVATMHSDVRLGFAGVQELHEILSDFREKSDKMTLVHALNMSSSKRSTYFSSESASPPRPL